MRERELEPECPVLKEENRALSIAYEDDIYLLVLIIYGTVTRI